MPPTNGGGMEIGMAVAESELIKKYRELDRDCALLSRRLYGAPVDAVEVFHCLIPDRKVQKELADRQAELLSRAQALEAPSLKFETLREHFLDFLQNLAREIDGLMESPAGPFSPILWGFGDIFRKSRKPQEEQARMAAELLGQIPAIRDGIREWLPECSENETASSVRAFRNAADELRDYLSGFGSLLTQASDGAREAVRAAMEKAAMELEAFADELDQEKCGAESCEAPDDSGKTVRMERESYERLLRLQYGVELDELIAWGDTETDRTRAACFEIAAKLAPQYGEDIPTNMVQVNDLLNRYAGPCDTPEEMLSRAASYLKRTKALAHEIFDLPADEDCACIKVPYGLRESYPWGGYEGGDSTARPIRGQMFLNVFNYKNVSDGWIRINCLHEAYPGHHVQYVKRITDPMPETVKIGAKSVALMEGMCIRTERAYQGLYDEAPFYPLFAAYRRHHASVRIKVDLMLLLEGRTIEDAVQVYMEELGFDRTSARGQVLSQEITPGYFTCYYYGLKKIEEWEKQYGFERDAYTRLLFAAGNISLANFERILKMEPAERESYLKDFGSLLS